MAIALLPFLLFPAVLFLAGTLAWSVRRESRGLSRFALVLAGIAGLCVANEFFQLAAKNAIRVDALLSLPLVALGALILGLAARRRRTILGSALLGVGGLSLAWFGTVMARSGVDSARLTAIFDDARKLYWQETSRCAASFEIRFGPQQSRDHPCRGNFTAAARNGGYPFSRMILNDAGQLFLLYSPERGVEENWGTLQDAPIARFPPQAEAGGVWIAVCSEATQCRSIELRSLAGGGCEAKVVLSNSRESVLQLTPVTGLATCDARAGTPVRSIGSFGAVFTGTGSNPLKQLVQIWLWDADGVSRALLLDARGYSGNATQFNFVKRLVGARTSDRTWELNAIDLHGERTSERLEVALDGDAATLSGNAARFILQQGNTLPRGKPVTHPKIELVPLGDPKRFVLYFDNVLHNLSVPWNVP